jgi:hypothetical protein
VGLAEKTTSSPKIVENLLHGVFINGEGADAGAFK